MSVAVASWDGRAVRELGAAWGVPLLEVHRSLGSTSDRAFELAGDGCGAFTVVVAEEQTAGRGRRGSRWHSAEGAGLWMSLVLPPGRTAPHVGLLVGLAAAEALEEAAPGVRIGIKWPNDLVTPRGKLGGILCEAAGEAVVAGVGINVREPGEGFPPELRGAATALEVETARSFQRSALAGLIVGRVKVWLSLEDEGLPADAMRALAQRDALLDRRVATEEHGAGTARGIDPDGGLVLERPDGSRVRVLAGSVRAL